MPARSETSSVHDRRVGLHLTERSLAPCVLDALERLGYPLVDDADHDAVHGTELVDARVRLVDTDRLDAIPPVETAPDLHLLVIGPSLQRPIEDPRYVAGTDRPGRLGPVYGMIQSALERTPRCAPRVATKLSARWIRADHRSTGAILSLSEGGCLLRTRESLRTGAKLALQFALPDYGLISTRAECRYARDGAVGLAFDEPGLDVRHTIAHFVTMELAGAGSELATAHSA